MCICDYGRVLIAKHAVLLCPAVLGLALPCPALPCPALPALPCPVQLYPLLSCAAWLQFTSSGLAVTCLTFLQIDEGCVRLATANALLKLAQSQENPVSADVYMQLALTMQVCQSNLSCAETRIRSIAFA